MSKKCEFNFSLAQHLRLNMQKHRVAQIILGLNSSKKKKGLLGFPEIIETQYLLVNRCNLKKIISVLTDGPFKTKYVNLVYFECFVPRGMAFYLIIIVLICILCFICLMTTLIRRKDCLAVHDISVSEWARTWASGKLH